MALLFLLSHQRSGSHFLKYTLNSHNDHLAKSRTSGVQYLALPEVLTPGIAQKEPCWRDWMYEPFLNDLVAANPAEWGNPAGFRKAMPLFLDALERRAAGQIVLLDIKLNQLHLGDDWFHEPTTCPRLIHEIVKRGKVVFLRRRNLVRAIISGMQATKSGVWHLKTDSACALPCETKLKVNSDVFITWVSQLNRGIAAADEWLASEGASVLRIDYEDLYDAQTLACNPAAFDRIAQFAGMAVGVSWQAPTQKIGLHSLSRVVSNYQELKAKIASSNYAAMLEA